MKIGSIQALRAVAALMVAAMHCFVLPPWGAIGVDIFFVISGFIMATTAPGRAPVQFLRARIWRIYPLYLASFPLVIWAEPFAIDPLKYIASLTLWPVWGTGYVLPYGVAWTLSFEMIFYGFTAVALATGRLWVPLAIYLACLIHYTATGAALTGLFGYPLALEFIAGAMLSALPRTRAAAAFALLTLPLAMIFTPGDAGLTDAARDWTRTASWGVPSVAIVYAALTFGENVRIWRPLLFLGNASFAIYLFHFPVREALKDALPPIPLFVLSVAVGIVAYLTIERWLMTFDRAGRPDRRVQGRGRAPDEAATTTNNAQVT